MTYFLRYNDFKWLFTPLSPLKEPATYALNMDYTLDREGGILYYKFKPGIHKFILNHNGKKYINNYYISENGFRNKEIKLLKDRYRIICFGGSSTAGIESPDQQTWPAYLEQFLSQDKVEVINMGIDGYDSQKIFQLLSNEAYKYKPDLVILYMGRNDIHYGYALILDKLYKKAIYRLHGVLYNKLISYTYMIDRIRISIEDGIVRRNANGFFFYAYAPFNRFAINFKKILDFCDNNNIRVVYVCEVVCYNNSCNVCLSLLDSILHDRHAKGVDKKDININFLTNLFRLQKNIKDFAKVYNHFQYIDPRIEFYEMMCKNRSAYFIDDGSENLHLTPLGNKLLAHIIAKEIKLYN